MPNFKSKKQISILVVAIVIIILFSLIGYFCFKKTGNGSSQSQQPALDANEKENVFVQIPQTDIKIILPSGYQQKPIEYYENILGDYLFVQFYNPSQFNELENFPVISEISLATGKSIANYISEINNSNQELINKMDDLYSYYEQKRTFDLGENYKNFKFRKIGDVDYQINERICRKDSHECATLLTTFLENIKIDLSIIFSEKISEKEIDEMVSRIKISDQNQDKIDLSKSLKSWYEKNEGKKIEDYIDENGNRILSEYANKNLEYTCISREERDLVIKARDMFNKQIAETTKYSNLEKGISLDFGKYGFSDKKDKINFGPKFLDGEDCGLREYRSYSLKFTNPRTKEEIIKKVKSMEFDDISDGQKLLETKKINNFDVVVWKTWGGYPTRSFSFEIPGKINNYLFTTDNIATFDNTEKDFEFVLKVIQTARLLDD